MDDIERFYTVLGLKPGASPKEVKQAYRDLVRVWHPDRFSHDPRLRQKAQEKLKDLNQAYSRLKTFLRGPRYQEHTPPKPAAPPPKPAAPIERRRGFTSLVRVVLISLETNVRTTLAIAGIKLHGLTFERRLKVALLLIAVIYFVFAMVYLIFIR